MEFPYVAVTFLGAWGQTHKKLTAGLSPIREMIEQYIEFT